jgi:hypothetical protein
MIVSWISFNEKTKVVFFVFEPVTHHVRSEKL